jgi:DNA-binding transcriptional regulator YdaS (Cro superfamily)
MDKTPIQRAVEAAGGQTALAKKLGVSQGLIWQWCDGRLKVPAERVLAVVNAADAAVTPCDLRPDIFGPAPRPEEQSDAV